MKVCQRHQPFIAYFYVSDGGVNRPKGEAMIRACPHCKVRLQPGEVYLGWCGECGNSFWQVPDGHALLSPDEQPGAAVPLPAEWRWVASGLLLKLVALLAGAVGTAAVASAADWDARLAFHDPLPVGVGVLLAAAVIDIAGRLLCLATPQAATRVLIIGSVVCQLCAVPLALGAMLSPPNVEWRWSLLVGAAAGQIAAAVMFTIYLYAVGVYLRSPPAMYLAALLQMIMAGAAAAVGVAAVVALILLVLFVIVVVVLIIFFPCLGFMVAAGAIGGIMQLGQEVVEPLVGILTLILGLVELVYGTTLGAVLWEFWRRGMRAR